jgi:hypothetical protein
LVYTAEGLEADVSSELAEFNELLMNLSAPTPREIAQSGCDLWAESLSEKRQDQMLLRIGVPPKDLPTLLLSEAMPPMEESSFVADLSGGLLYVRGTLDVGIFREQAQSHGGYCVVLQSPDHNELDLWGYEPSALDLMQGLKHRWDGKGLFNANAFIL